MTVQKKLLEEDEKTADEEFHLGERLLNDSSKSRSGAIQRKDMIRIKLAYEIVEAAGKYYHEATSHINEQIKMHCKIG